MKLAKILPEPVPKRRKKPPTELEKKKEIFITALYEGEYIASALEQSGLSRCEIFEWTDPQSQSHDEEFARQVADARKAGAELRQIKREDECDRRGCEGWLEPVYQRGRLAGYIRRYSDDLLIFMVEAYGEPRFKRASSGSKELTMPNDGESVGVIRYPFPEKPPA